jgi:hypothetical protein
MFLFDKVITTRQRVDVDRLFLGDVIADKGEFELKYAFDNLRAPLVEAWVLCHCSRDPSHPVARVQSIYLETMDRSSYAEKINSDFYKTKYRVRWYEDVGPGVPTLKQDQPVFLEKKMKVGSKRLKSRSTQHFSVEEIRRHDLSSPYHGIWHKLFAKNGDIGFLEPFIQISYIRKRFVDPFTKARFSLDCDIRVDRWNPLYLPNPGITTLPQAVFEIKTDSNIPPGCMHYLTSILARKTCFSKYERCVSLFNKR